MTNFEKTALYKRIADFMNVMDEDELRELAEVCNVEANLRQQNRREHQRDELIKNLQDVLTAILRAGFSVDIENVDNPNWIVKLMPDETYSIEMHYVGK